MKKLIIVSLLLMLVSGCSKGKPTDTKPEIFVSFYALESFTEEIAGDRADVTNLSKNGSMHDFEISATQMAKLSEADLFIYSGGADHWAKDVAKTAESEGCKTLALSTQNTDDPHTWLDLDTAIEQMEMIHDALCVISPDDSGYFAENLEKAKENYAALKDKANSMLTKTKGKTLVVSHGAYAHLLSGLQMEQLAIEGIHSEGDPTAAQMAKTIDFIKENNIKYIFVSANESSKNAAAVADETSASLLTLDSMEANSENGGYFEVMEKNLDTIEQSIAD